MMQTLKIHISKTGKNEPDTKISLPLSSLHISEKLLPSKVRAMLKTEGINIGELSALFGKQGPKGTLIQVENANEKLEILLE